MNVDPVRAATRLDRDNVVDALANAFSADPMLHWMFRSPAPPKKRLQLFFGAIVDAEFAKPDNPTFIVGDGAGASVWRNLGDKGPSNIEVLRSAVPLVRAMRLGIGRSLRAVSAIDKAHPVEPHVYLFFVGVHQDHRGKGYGGTLLTPMLERCDTDGIPAYLENSNPVNEAFYARHGFVQRGRIDLPKGAPPLIPMWREPR